MEKRLIVLTVLACKYVIYMYIYCVFKRRIIQYMFQTKSYNGLGIIVYNSNAYSKCFSEFYVEFLFAFLNPI